MNLEAPTSSQRTSQKTWQYVAECLYRNSSSGNYYAFIKSGSKQFRRSLNTQDFVMAKRRLAELRTKVGRVGDGPESLNIRFEELAQRWLDNLMTHLKASSLRRRKVSSKQLVAHFGPQIVRNLSRRDCDDWAKKRAQETAPSTVTVRRSRILPLGRRGVARVRRAARV